MVNREVTAIFWVSSPEDIAANNNCLPICRTFYGGPKTDYFARTAQALFSSCARAQQRGIRMAELEKHSLSFGPLDLSKLIVQNTFGLFIQSGESLAGKPALSTAM